MGRIVIYTVRAKKYDSYEKRGGKRCVQERFFVKHFPYVSLLCDDTDKADYRNGCYYDNEVRNGKSKIKYSAAQKRTVIKGRKHTSPKLKGKSYVAVAVKRAYDTHEQKGSCDREEIISSRCDKLWKSVSELFTSEADFFIFIKPIIPKNKKVMYVRTFK